MVADKGPASVALNHEMRLTEALLACRAAEDGRDSAARAHLVHACFAALDSLRADKPLAPYARTLRQLCHCLEEVTLGPAESASEALTAGARVPYYVRAHALARERDDLTLRIADVEKELDAVKADRDLVRANMVATQAALEKVRETLAAREVDINALQMQHDLEAAGAEEHGRQVRAAVSALERALTTARAELNNAKREAEGLRASSESKEAMRMAFAKVEAMCIAGATDTLAAVDAGDEDRAEDGDGDGGGHGLHGVAPHGGALHVSAATAVGLAARSGSDGESAPFGVLDAAVAPQGKAPASPGAAAGEENEGVRAHPPTRPAPQPSLRSRAAMRERRALESQLLVLRDIRIEEHSRQVRALLTPRADVPLAPAVGAEGEHTSDGASAGTPPPLGRTWPPGAGAGAGPGAAAGAATGTGLSTGPVVSMAALAHHLSAAKASLATDLSEVLSELSALQSHTDAIARATGRQGPPTPGLGDTPTGLVAGPEVVGPDVSLSPGMSGLAPSHSGADARPSSPVLPRGEKPSTAPRGGASPRAPRAHVYAQAAARSAHGSSARKQTGRSGSARDTEGVNAGTVTDRSPAEVSNCPGLGPPLPDQPLWAALRARGSRCAPKHPHVLDPCEVLQLVEEVYESKFEREAAMARRHAAQAGGNGRHSPSEGSGVEVGGGGSRSGFRLCPLGRHLLDHLDALYGMERVVQLLGHAFLSGARDLAPSEPTARLFLSCVSGELPEASWVHALALRRRLTARAATFQLSRGRSARWAANGAAGHASPAVVAAAAGAGAAGSKAAPACITCAAAALTTGASRGPKSDADRGAPSALTSLFTSPTGLLRFLLDAVYPQRVYGESGATSNAVQAFAADLAARAARELRDRGRAPSAESIAHFLEAAVDATARPFGPGLRHASQGERAEPGHCASNSEGRGDPPLPPEPRVSRMVRLLSWADERQTGRLGLERFRHVILGSVAPRCPHADLSRAFRYAAQLEPQHGLAVSVEALAHVAASLELLHACDTPLPPRVRPPGFGSGPEPIVHIPVIGADGCAHLAWE